MGFIGKEEGRIRRVAARVNTGPDAKLHKYKQPHASATAVENELLHYNKANALRVLASSGCLIVTGTIFQKHIMAV